MLLEPQIYGGTKYYPGPHSKWNRGRLKTRQSVDITRRYGNNCREMAQDRMWWSDRREAFVHQWNSDAVSKRHKQLQRDHHISCVSFFLVRKVKERTKLHDILQRLKRQKMELGRPCC